ncbi:CsbD family protein [Microbacterium karelineae]|uniref:CsbD family protein n=1 Tax=Microbacterium karelineae TaxID=2654283 RepID=UPI0027D20589|nr:CsbD family protein [Microbacterium karelineae]
MNATNRALNRGLLLLVGALLASVGAALVVVSAPPERFGGMRGAIVDASAAAMAPTLDVASGVRVPMAGVIAAAVALVAVIGIIAFIATRGRGHTTTVAWDEGGTSVDRSVADAVIAGALRDRTDVLSVRTTSAEVRRSPVIGLTLRARRGADLAQIVRAAEHAIEEWDAFAGREVPILVHLAGPRWVDGWHSATRVRGPGGASAPLTSRPEIGARRREGDNAMSAEDKIKAAADKAKGKAKEVAGKATDDRGLVAEGKADQAKGHAREAAGEVKDAAKDVKDSFEK